MFQPSSWFNPLCLDGLVRGRRELRWKANDEFGFALHQHRVWPLLGLDETELFEYGEARAQDARSAQVQPIVPDVICANATVAAHVVPDERMGEHESGIVVARETVQRAA